MHAIDSGTITMETGSTAFMVLMTIVTICGLFITSVLIGIVNTGIETKMVTLSKGKSLVLVENHTVLLGFNRNTFTILEKLFEANANQKDAVIVLMDDCMSMVAMEDMIRQKFPSTGNTRLICRTGKMTDLSDVDICSPETAQSIIINSDDDFVTIKSILTVTTLLKRADNRSTYITAAIRSRENYQAALVAGENRVEILFFENTISRIIAHASRQPGFSTIFMELFGYTGDEIYVEEIPEVTGLTMDKLNLYFPRSTVMGLEKKEKILLNPSPDTPVEQGDKLILLSEDDHRSVPSPEPAPINAKAILWDKTNTPDGKQKILILGYSPRIGMILQEQDKFMAPESHILLAVQREYEEQTRQLLQPEYRNIHVQLICDAIYHKSVLSRLLDWAPDSVLVTSSMMEDSQQDDNKTLLLLLQLRALDRERKQRHTITSEMREVENQEVAQITEVRDFVISSKITSMMITQISKSRKLNRIFSELLTSEGSEIYMRPAGDYVKLGKPLDMYSAGAAATNKGQVLIGYRRLDPESGQFEIYTNPPKNTVVEFCEDDRFIVLSQQ